MQATDDTRNGRARASAPVSAPTILVVGAGPAGLGAAAALRRLGLGAVVLEAAGSVGAAWRGRYERLRLNTSRPLSRVAGVPHRRGTELFPPRDDFITYLHDVVDREDLDVRLGVRVDRIDRTGRAWTLRTSAGDLLADDVVVATGYARVPYVPPWPGRDAFAPPLLHAAAYRDPGRFRGRDVLVVGAGCSGKEIAHDLAAGGARRVRMAVRTPPNIVLRSIGGLPADPVGVALAALPPRVADAPEGVVRRLAVGDLAGHGLPRPAEGTFARLRRLGVSPAVIDREVVDAIKAGRIAVVPGVERLDATGATLADGSRVEPDAVVAATGYRCGLEPLVGHLRVLDGRGRPRVTGGAEAAPGLRFVGFEPVPAQIRHSGIEARRAARAIRRAR